MKEHIHQLIQKYSEDKINLKEKIELSELLSDHQNIESEQILKEEWNLHLESENPSNRDFGIILDRVHHHIRLNENGKQFKINWMHNFQRIAAVLIFPLFLSFLTYIYVQNFSTPRNAPYVEIQCPLGVRTKFQLPDGSTGFLNSGSRLKYPVSFGKERSVELIGEAFFEVVHDKKSPFHVNTRNLDIKVLGTTFNVLANGDETEEEIVLQNGKVDVSLKNGKHLDFLLPNEQITLNIEKQTFFKKGVVASQYSMWKEGKLVFRNENMKQLAHRLSKWYNADVVVDDNLLDDYTFHATFIDEPLDEVLKLISITTPITYSEERREVNKGEIYQKRKIILRINKLKYDQFR